MSALIRLFSDLDRLGPGNAESLRWALGIAEVSPDARVLDAGCGTGADLATLLASVPDGTVIAVDREAAFIERARKRSSRVSVHVGDFIEPPEGPFDLIWSAGAVYHVGVESALRAWRGHLGPRGRVAFSDIRWRGRDRPEPVRAFFEDADGVVLGGVTDLEDEIARADFRVMEARWLGTPGWASYYGPLEAALDSADADPEQIAILRAEIALWRTHGVSYGCRIVVCEPV